jgi:hypothetical protein
MPVRVRIPLSSGRQAGFRARSRARCASCIYLDHHTDLRGVGQLHDCLDVGLGAWYVGEPQVQLGLLAQHHPVETGLETRGEAGAELGLRDGDESGGVVSWRFQKTERASGSASSSARSSSMASRTTSAGRTSVSMTRFRESARIVSTWAGAGGSRSALVPHRGPRRRQREPRIV